MSFGVIFLLTDPQHTTRLVVSIYNLRKFYDGPITLFTTRAKSAQLTDRLLGDDRLRIDLATAVEADVGMNSSYVTKPRLLSQTPYDATLFLDADTLVVGDITELVEATQQHPLVVTGFCNWTTQHPAIRQRFEKWVPLAGSPEDRFDLAELIDFSLRNAVPVVNTGVFGYHRASPVLEHWRKLADFGKDTFLPDEMALQILLPRVQHFLLNTKYNCARAFMENPVDIRIWHFVATTHLWHEESRLIWQTAYEECRAQNVAGIRAWSRFERHEGPPPDDYIPSSVAE